MKCHLTPTILGILCIFGNCNGNATLVITNGSSVCGNCINFSCVANYTNTAYILQNGSVCQVFERSGPSAPNNCTELSILNTDIQKNPNQPLLTDFTIYSQKCFEGRVNYITIECMDASHTTDTLLLQVNSSSCAPTLECRTNCSNCPKGLGIGIIQPLQCQSSFQITDQSAKIYSYAGCLCKFPLSIFAVNKCGEKVMLESPHCTPGSNLDGKNKNIAKTMQLTSSQALFTLTTLLGIVHQHPL